MKIGILSLVTVLILLEKELIDANPKVKGYWCGDCLVTEDMEVEDDFEGCLSGINVLPQECAEPPKNTSCVTTVYKKDGRDVKVERGCSDIHDDTCDDDNINNSTSCYCTPNVVEVVCNPAITPNVKQILWCLECSLSKTAAGYTEEHNENNRCATGFNVFARICGLDDKSCYTKVSRENGRDMKVERGCSKEDKGVNTPECDPKDVVGETTSETCYCNLDKGKGHRCNNAPVPIKPLQCRQCLLNKNTYSASQHAEQLECLTGTIEAEDCFLTPTTRDLDKSCTTTVWRRNGRNVAIERGCTNLPKTECGEEVRQTDGSVFKTCYCQEDGCNDKSHLYPVGSEPLKCLQCSHSVNNEDIKCKEGTTEATPCTTPGEDISCYYEVEKEINPSTNEKEVKSLTRGCSAMNTIESYASLDNDCKTDGSKETCHCFKDNCNRNSDKGLMCAACEADNDNCSTGNLAESEFQPCLSLGADLNSCKESQIEANDTGEIIYIRRCADEFREDGECDEPTFTSPRVKRTECYCNTDRCILHTHINPPKKTKPKSTANANSSSAVKLILSVVTTLRFLF